jgi:hypothetical protein
MKPRQIILTSTDAVIFGVFSVFFILAIVFTVPPAKTHRERQKTRPKMCWEVLLSFRCSAFFVFWIWGFAPFYNFFAIL